MKLTRKQKEAIRDLYRRNPNGSASYLQFRRRVFPMFLGGGAVAIHWCGMFVGIEPDGYTHT